MVYEWQVPVEVNPVAIRATVTVGPNPEVGQAVAVFITLNNSRTTDSTGDLKVEALGPVADLIGAEVITIPMSSSVTKEYSWIPQYAGSYTIRITYAE